MSVFGTPPTPPLPPAAAQAIAAIPQAERVHGKTAAERRGNRPAKPDAIRDEVEISGAQAEDAVRSLKNTTDEETLEDRRKQDGYRPVGTPDGTPPPADRPRLDIEG